MAETLSCEGLKSLEGQEIGRSDWLEVSQARIDAFADVTEDWQAIHLDPSVGRATGFGGTIAHGFLTVSLLSTMAYSAMPKIEGQVASINYGFDRVRFLEPVSAGSRLRGRFVLQALEHKTKNAVLMITQVTVEAEQISRPVLIADWRILYKFG